MSHIDVEVCDLSPTLRVRVVYDDCPEEPYNDIAKIAYLANSRHVLGNEAVSRDEMDEIAKGIEDGTLVGMPVQAYVHSGVVIRASHSNPFPDARWDSGQSGFVYCTREQAVEEWGNKVCTRKVKEKACKYLAACVDEYSSYLNGEVYGYLVERLERDEDGDVVDSEVIDSCWGFIGDEKYCLSEGLHAAEHHLDEPQPA